MTAHKLQIWAGAFGLTGVALGAFGAHVFNDRLAANGHAGTWQTAVQYQLIHAVGIVAVAALMRSSAASRPQILAWTAYCWMVGIVLFSGSLYALSLGGSKWFGPVTPAGGLAFLAGWVLLMFSRPSPTVPPKG
jgi:uncharacterized membrane protein YgdD (TMEM256/DUF423 family)